MAKAIFENITSRGTRTAPRRGEGNFTLKLQDGGEKRVETEAPTKVPLSGNRTLYEEDFSTTESSRAERAHREFQSSISDRYSQIPQGTVAANAVASMSPRNEAYGETARRILQTGQQWTPKLQHPGETSVPGTGWYFNQHNFYEENSGSRNPRDIDRAIVGGGAMSPMNDPVLERAAGVELSKAHLDKAPVTLTKAMAKWINTRHKYDSKGNLKKTPKGMVEDHQVSSPVAINDLHPDVIGTLKSREARDTFPNFYKKSEINWDNIAKGAANVSQGVRGIRGATADELSPGQTSPKVHTYTKNILNFINASPQHRTAYDALVSASVQGTPAPNINKSFTLTNELAEHVLQTFGKGTDSFNPRDRAVQQVELNRGQTVHSDDLHPAIVGALGHRDVAVNHPTVHLAALTSVNHPTVSDTWMNAAIMGQPQATVLPVNYLNKKAQGVPVSTPTNVTSLYKLSGSNYKPGKDEASAGMKSEYKTGYRTTKTLQSGETILDVPNTNLKPESIQHATNDKIIRMSAELSGDEYGTGVNLPSVAVQESIGWTVPRAVSGKDKTRNIRGQR
jgi:hypothetical protein